MPSLLPAPDLKQIVDERIGLKNERLNTFIPARIVSYDNKKQTVTVRPVMYESDKDGVSRKFADIASVPVVFPSAGGGSLTFPIKAGDDCVVLFSQRDFSGWWVTNKVPSQSPTQRYHDYNDAIAIVGLTSKNNSLEASTENVELTFEDSSGSMLSKITMKPDGVLVLENKDNAKITLTQDKFRIENDQEELLAILSEVIGLLGDPSQTRTNTAIGLMPLNNFSSFQALQTRLDKLKG